MLAACAVDAGAQARTIDHRVFDNVYQADHTIEK
jgi:hypothetical protein